MSIHRTIIRTVIWTRKMIAKFITACIALDIEDCFILIKF